jgi:serine/threonine protein kinase
VEDDALQQKTQGLTNKCPTCGLAVSATQTNCPVDGTSLNQCLPGFVLDGKYEFIELIGSGGMGVIYKARQIILNRPVAVKMLHSHMISDKALMRFQREGKAGSTLSHQNITVVLDFALSEHGQPYMVMDFEVGQTLAQMIESQSALSPTFVVEALIQICHGLTHAHERGVLHRDIKPSNLMVVSNASTPPQIKILDFGVAKIIEDGDSKNKQLTRTGETMGSPPYMSPEQALGSNIEKRSDLYSLGCVMFECLSGTPPFMSDNVFNIMISHANQEPPTLKEASLGTSFPNELERIVKKLLEKKPAERYQSAEELEADLQSFKLGRSVSSKNDNAASKRSPLPLIISLGSLVVLALAIATSFIVNSISPRISSANRNGITGGTKNTVAESSGQNSNGQEVPGKNSAAKDSNSGAPKPLTEAQLMAESEKNSMLNEPTILGGKAFITSYLASNNGHDHLKLGSHDIEDPDLQVLDQATTCQRLDLQNNNITGPGLKYLSKLKNISILRLDHNYIQDGFLQPILDLPKLASLDLSFNKNLTGSDFHLFGGKHNLIELNLENSGISDQGLEELTKFGPVFGINLAHTKVTSKGMSALGSIKNLHSLDLSDTLVDKVGLATLCKENPSIWTLYLAGNKIGDNSVPDILKLKNLKSLDVSATNITANGIRQLGELKKLERMWCGSCNAGYTPYEIMKRKPQLKIEVNPRTEKSDAGLILPKNLGKSI